MEYGISPDESYAIIESWQDANKKDLYISFRNEDDSWTKLKNMGPKINTPGFEGMPKVSNDGKYLFFWSDRSVKICIYWIRVDKIINDLKDKTFNSEDIK
jgi:Tol biopolymer transport system component